MGEVRITRAVEFSTSLRYRNSDWSEEENRRRFGPRAARHGHNYRLEVSLRGHPDPVTGMVMDLKELADLLDREVMARFDHRDLNEDTDLFEKVVPTAENFALALAGILRGALPEGLLDRIRLFEGPDLWVDVIETPSGSPAS
jgi:6-pyruvoyltetrahydropterin/6-carboxytetrahydropterin synthase